MAPLSTKEKIVLQQIMWKRCITREEATMLLSKLSVADEFEHFIRPINQAIGAFRMKITRGIDESNGEIHFALVNMAETFISRLCVQYNVEQQKVLRVVLELLIRSGDGMFTFNELYELLLKYETRFTRTQTHAFLDTLKSGRFICMSGKKFCLDVRGCIELEPYFVQHFGDKMESCNACRVMCLRGSHCAYCSIKLHQPCLNRSLQELGGKCPSCSKDWMARSMEENVSDSDDSNPLNDIPIGESQAIASQFD